MESFSNNTKKELLVGEKTRKCCLFSFMYGALYFFETENDSLVLKKTNAENAEMLEKVISSITKNSNFRYDEKRREIRVSKGICRFFTFVEYEQNLFKCENCENYFLRGLFLRCGTLNDPYKSYRLELVFDTEEKRNPINSFLIDIGFTTKIATRKNKYIIYLTDSEQIENFLTKIGAVNATFAVMNSKIYKEFVNNANRVANCDNANINKSLKANEKYINAISELIETNKFDSLPEQLKETAIKRMEFKELNFEQLGKKFEPVISKSGMYHRLEKIYDIYKNSFKK